MAIVRTETANGHSYKIDGKRADGVTTLIGSGLPKPALTYWAANSVARYVSDRRERMREAFDWMDNGQLYDLLRKVPWSERDKAAVRGTDVHHLAEKLLHDEEVEVPPDLAGYVAACVQFLDDWQVRPVLSETTVASRAHNYCGTLDLVGDLPDGRRAVIDWKTGASGIWPDVALQLAAYRRAEVYLKDDTERPLADLNIGDKGFAVWLRPDGYSVYSMDIGAEAFSTFLNVAAVARWAKASKGLVGDPLALPEWARVAA